MPLAAETKTVPGLTPNGGWERERDETADTLVQACASLCTIHFACGISKRYFAPRGVAERGVSIRSRPSTSRFHTRTVPPENALERVTRATEILFDRYKLVLGILLYVKTEIGMLRLSSISYTFCTDRLSVTPHFIRIAARSLASTSLVGSCCLEAQYFRERQ